MIGSLDLQQALGTGHVSYEPGLLAAAHRGILYVDEVNLLHDHLVDLLLDAAAMGRSTVERDGVSVAHAARLVLVGTMNPEEGELRPQLLDRFGLTVEVAAPRDPGPALRGGPTAAGVRRRPGGAGGAVRRSGGDAAVAAGGRPGAARSGAAVGLGADQDRRRLRRLRGGRHAGRHRHRAGRRGARGLARPDRGDPGRHPRRRAAGSPPPPAPEPVRRSRAGRGPAGSAAR